MSAEGTVTFWLGVLKAGDARAAQPLWEGYFARLVGLARSKLRGARRRAADEEDVALSAFDSFCRGAVANRFPKLTDRDDLWQVLILITARKAIDLRQHEQRKKRGGDVAHAGAEDTGVLEQVIGREPTADFALQVVEEWELLLSKLPDEDARKIALWKMEGDTNDEIACRLGVATRTVERRLRLIRELIGRPGDHP